jgi:hypothetical protein
VSQASHGRQTFYDGDAGVFTPLGVSRSPWNPRHQNGAAIAGLLTHLAETVETPVPMLPAHITIDILRPTPFAPIEGRASVVRPGKKMQLVESILVADGEVVARARVLRVREAPCPHVAEPMPYPAVEAVEPRPFFSAGTVFGDLIETRVVSGTNGEPGPGVIWTRFNADIVAGAPIRGMVHAGMLSDFGNGVSNVLQRGHWSFANVDISLHLARRPTGDWLLIDAQTMLHGRGVGLVNSVLADQDGPFGRAHQTLFIAEMAAR